MDTPVRVLLVDDDEDEHLIVGDLLRSALGDQFELTWVSTYKDGLEMILSSTFDVCLVDYRLGERSGLDLLAEALAQSGDAQIILLTGVGDREVDLQANRAGAADFLTKADLTSVLLERAIRYTAERGRTLKALRRATQAAEASNLAKSDFLAAMSHEIRTPMNAILGMADVLCGTQLDAKQQRYLGVVRRAGATLLALIDDVLDLSKIEARQLELECVEFDLREALGMAVDLVSPSADAKGLRIEQLLDCNIHTRLLGDPVRLQQVLINLLGNAVKFTDEGSIQLAVCLVPMARTGEIEFAVSDTGIGIAHEKLGTIFENFTQADSSTTRKYGGTGLGLSISRYLVEKMGGLLEVSSTLAAGSRFSFRVALNPAEPIQPFVSNNQFDWRHDKAAA